MDEHMELLVELMRKTIEQKDEQIQKLNETIEELRVTIMYPIGWTNLKVHSLKSDR